MNNMIRRSMCTCFKDVYEFGSLSCSIIYTPKSLRMGSWGSKNHDDDMFQLDYKDDLVVDVSVKLKSILESHDINKVKTIIMSSFWFRCLKVALVKV